MEPAHNRGTDALNFGWSGLAPSVILVKMTLLLFVPLIFGQVDAYAERQRDYWHDRYRHGRLQSIELTWYQEASQIWRAKYVFWSCTQKLTSLLELTGIVTLFAGVALTAITI